MAKIHWLVYVIVGLFVSIASYKLNYEKLIFFFYAGLIFVFSGVAKLIFGLLQNRKGRESSQKIHQHKAQHQAGIKYCTHCGNPAKIHDKFCNRCGARF